MRRVVLILAAAGVAMSTAACGGTDVTVMAQLQGESTGTQETEAVALGELPIRLIPFDRDAVFDSLAQAYPEPEPEIPDSITALRDRVLASQATWRDADTRWTTLRDSLQALSDSLAAMNQSDAEYFVLFQDFADLEAEVNRLQDESDSSFEEFNTSLSQFNTQSREIELARQNWAAEAFSSVDSIFTARQEELGLEVRYDTTSAQGVVRFTGVEDGQWWVNARYDRQFDELYWNVPVDVTGDTVVVRLTEENAEVRQKM